MALYVILPIGQIFNIIQYSTSYENRKKLLRHRKAIMVSNHTTFFDPLKLGGACFPFRTWHTMLEATVESPWLGTLTRLLGGMPIPRGRNSLKELLAASSTAFKMRRYMLFYPEGECYLYNQRINNFQIGAFYLSAELNIPVVPMVTVFSEGKHKPFTFLGRVFPKEKLVILDAVYPSQYIRHDEDGKIDPGSIREYAQAVHAIMQQAIDDRHGSSAFYKGRMERIKGING
jgi:1-acyl-sn-glycerol-3-phosphate acyltransferase